VIICQDQKDFNTEIKNIRHNLILHEYPQELHIAATRNNDPSSDTYTRALSLSYISKVSLRNSHTLKAGSMSGPFSKLNIHSMGH
jgi:hypothetical protein